MSDEGMLRSVPSSRFCTLGLALSILAVGAVGAVGVARAADRPNVVLMLADNVVMVEHDHRVGQVLDAIDGAGIAGNTLVIYASDNGPDREEVDLFTRQYLWVMQPTMAHISRFLLSVRRFGLIPPGGEERSAGAVRIPFISDVDALQELETTM